MGRKCCVTHCKGNYDAENKAAVFRLPSDKMERERWLKVIPRDNIPDSKDSSVCEIHWPKGYSTIRVHGKVRPRDPPSIFPGVPKSMIPRPPSKPRPTSKTSLKVRGKKEDELTSFLQKDKITNEKSH